MKDEIIYNLFKDKKLIQMAKRISKHNDFAYDMVNELYITLQNKPNDFIINLHNQGTLINYCSSVLYFSWNSPTSPFYREYRAKSNSLTIIGDVLDVIDEDYKNDFDFDFWLDKINTKKHNEDKPTYVKVRVFEKYLQLKSYRKVGLEFGIPHKTIEYIVKQFVKELKDEKDISSNKSQNNRS